MRPPKRNKRTEAREILSEAVKIQRPWRKISEDLLGKVDAARARGEVRLTDPSMSIDTRMSALSKQRATKAFAIPVAGVALLILSLTFTLTFPAAAQTNYFTNWPTGTSPAEVGKRVAEHFVTSPHADPQHIVYQEVCTWYGALTFAQLSGDKDLSAKLIQRFDPLMTPAGARLIGQDRHVDFTVFGTVPLEMYLETKDPKYLDLGKSFAD